MMYYFLFRGDVIFLRIWIPIQRATDPDSEAQHSGINRRKADYCQTQELCYLSPERCESRGSGCCRGSPGGCPDCCTERCRGTAAAAAVAAVADPGSPGTGCCTCGSREKLVYFKNRSQNTTMNTKFQFLKKYGIEEMSPARFAWYCCKNNNFQKIKYTLSAQNLAKPSNKPQKRVKQRKQPEPDPGR
jgi:hypothetical protein